MAKTLTPDVHALQAEIDARIARKQQLNADFEARCNPIDERPEIAALEQQISDLRAVQQRPAYDAAIARHAAAKAHLAKQIEGLDRAIIGLAPSIRAIFDAHIDVFEAAAGVRDAASGSSLGMNLWFLGNQMDPRSERADVFSYAAINDRLLELAEGELGRALKRGRSK